MAVKIKRLVNELSSDYECLIDQSHTAMFNHSLRFKTFLNRILPGAEDHYLLAFEGNELKGALPLFIKDGPLGPVANSLPFYGSHGGIVTLPDAGPAVGHALLQAHSELCRSRGVICSSIIESPLSPKDASTSYQSDFLDQRIGQITPLPACCDENTVSELLLAQCHQKTRNAIRKGMRSGVKACNDGTCENFRRLHSLHDQNIRSIGGQPKTWDVFDAIYEIFRYDREYRIYYAEMEGVVISMLLVFYFKDMVEYFTPAVLAEYRSLQPLSFLIFTAMRDAIIDRGAKRWNWGGTWLSQEGVYRFKSRWGTSDYPYHYYIQTDRSKLEAIKESTAANLLAGYPHFYTIPFSELVSK